MAIKRIIGRQGKKFRSCLNCGQQHLIDVYADRIAITVAERPEIRRRPVAKVTPR